MEWIVGTLILGLLTLIPGHIHTEITIDAPGDDVWNNLVAFDTYGEWNPFIQRISGELVPQKQLDINLVLDETSSMHFTPDVVWVEKQKGFCWKGRLGMPLIFDGRHCFEIEKINATTSRLIQKERFNGLLVWLVYPWVIPKSKKGFEAMNNALKVRVETTR